MKSRKPVVASVPNGTDLALQRVLSAWVLALSAQGAIPLALLASSATKADKQKQAIFRTDDTLLVQHGLGLLVFEEDLQLTINWSLSGGEFWAPKASLANPLAAGCHHHEQGALFQRRRW